MTFVPSNSNRNRTSRAPASAIAFSAIATGISILVIGIVAETFLRIRYENIAQITGVTEWQISERGLLTYRWDQYHPRYGWTNRPDYRSDDRLPSFHVR